ncbi:cell wall metabolism sensor histidine kinase WalK [Microlunatus sp. Gsoil 973]|uniref:sensor histidine kinase n=1 Tax=Microlunatus sp. Gsoil 973 TaxID=2672569 RepID=UPI0012B4E953|nr:ATP-binding protein [Microlunatus sp. Gsoil 973]QGN33742.1 two-component sensor histidine kinase [Microlunatus sp. Gsoil 973]
MNAGAVGLGLAVGLLVGGFAVWLLSNRKRSSDAANDQSSQQHRAVPEGVSEVLSAIGSSAVLVGPDGAIVEATRQARSLGLVRGSRLVVPVLQTMVRDVREDGVARSAELEFKRGGSGSVEVVIKARVAPLGRGLIVVVAEDLTAARRVEATRRDFVANVSHELKTPIGAVALLAEAVAEAADDPEAVHRFAARLSIESDRLSELVQQIIDLSRVQADDPLAHAEMVEVDDVLKDAIQRYGADAERREISVTVGGEHGSTVLGSHDQLVVAVGNLIANAIIYSDPGARVAVAASTAKRDQDEIVKITVSDNGIGISRADIGRIFERFYRVDFARSRANGGTGLGLSIVKHIVAAHGGDVSVWSQPGQGSTFTLSLPTPAVGQHSPDGRPRSDAEPAPSRTSEPQEIVR